MTRERLLLHGTVRKWRYFCLLLLIAWFLFPLVKLFTVWAIILPSGMAYLLSAQGPGETEIPLLSHIFQFLLKGEMGPADVGR